MADNLQVSQKKENETSVNLLSLNVVRRDGSISSFKSDKISDAIKKAFLIEILRSTLRLVITKEPPTIKYRRIGTA